MSGTRRRARVRHRCVWARWTPIIQQAIADHNIPGRGAGGGHDGKVIYRKAYGERSLEPRREAMTLDTIFDLASLTKVIATTTAVMQLMELGKMRHE